MSLVQGKDVDVALPTQFRNKKRVQVKSGNG